jgi:hypothetical protein
MNETIDVLFAPVGKPVERRTVNNDLKTLQELVGGNIEIVAMGFDVVLVCSEEGKLHKRPPNRPCGLDVICGDFFVCALGEGEEFVSLRDTQFTYYEQIFNTTMIKYLTPQNTSAPKVLQPSRR